MSDDVSVLQQTEPLEKKCPRCGGASANSRNPSGRCSSCLKKLKTAKKTPGHWQRAQTKADDALRRQKGKNGTAHKKSSGLGSRKSIVKQTQAAEKKTGEKLSPDRKNNSKGYASSNTRMVPEKLNRGRHHVDEKKLRNWRKKLKKHDIDTASLYTLMKAKFQDNDEILELLKSLGPEGLEQYIELFDDALLEKSAVPKASPAGQPHPLDQHVGKVHTVEIHPDMDHLYRAKGLITENNKQHLHIGDYKRANFPKDVINKLPRDAKGRVTPELIDKHIEGLPKHKVNVHLQPYTWGAQQHRPGEQYVASVHLHPESKLKMTPEHQALWDHVKGSQHKFDENMPDQVGWARIDAHSKPDHWHLDEIQSDFQNKRKMDARAKTSELNADHADGLHQHLSHDHDDPQHLVHSAMNALGRKLGVKSMSMDAAHDQAKQSNLKTTKDSFDENAYHNWLTSRLGDANKETHENLWGGEAFNNFMENSHKNPNFVSGLDKIGGLDALKHLADNSAVQGEHIDLAEGYNVDEEDKAHGDGKLMSKIQTLSEPELHAVEEALVNYQNWVNDTSHDRISQQYPGYDAPEEPEDDKFDMSKLPVHQLDTYHKRPRKLGMKMVDKNKLLGENPDDRSTHVQYMNLHKKLQFILEELRKAKK